MNCISSKTKRLNKRPQPIKQIGKVCVSISFIRPHPEISNSLIFLCQLTIVDVKRSYEYTSLYCRTTRWYLKAFRFPYDFLLHCQSKEVLINLQCTRIQLGF